jgi:Xaa-Pro aminopeptidase
MFWEMLILKEYFINNRKKLYNEIENGDLAILFAGEAPTKRGDEKYPFSPDRNFYYMTGIERERIIYTAKKENGNVSDTLYIEPDNGQAARWIGATLTPDECRDISGIENIKFIPDFEQDMKNSVKNTKTLFLDCERRDLEFSYTPEGMRKIFKDTAFDDLFPIISEMRVIKEDWEIERLRKAIDITRLGVEEMMKKCRPEMMEYEIEANYDYILKKNGVTDKAFQTIAASGMNGTTLHYMKNNCKTGNNDLILIDAGAQYKWYNGDISRTFPVSGKFTEKQKEIYNIVLKGQQLVIDNIKPGVLYPDLNEMLKDYYFEELKKIGLAKTKEDVFEYYFHNVSHFIGAETHDVGDRGQKLRKGMVISVEPGLYIKELGIGIRIEDDALVTDDGCEILTKDMIKTVDDIENFMAKENENVRF